MQDNTTLSGTITNNYIIQVIRAFGTPDPACRALDNIVKTLNEIYRYFEPEFFTGNFYVIKSFTDQPCFEVTKENLLYDKNILINRTSGNLFIQTLNENTRLYLWEDKDVTELMNRNDLLVYHFSNNSECYYANTTKVDVIDPNPGSMYATQFSELQRALIEYAVSKIYHSSCEHFNESWIKNENRIFFRGGGSGNNIPEKFMQVSLYEFLDTYLGRGITMDTVREYNNVGDFSKPKPVDVRIHWRDANRSALIEVKFMGTIKKDKDQEIHDYDDTKANKGIVQLKEYFDAAKKDSPKTIIKSILVVIDGRRNNLTKDKTTISEQDGFHYKDVEIIFKEENKFFERITGFEKPIRMFAAPICI